MLVAGDGVFDQVLEGFLVVAVLEDLPPGLARGVGVAELLLVELRRLAPRRDALGLVGEAFAAGRQELYELAPLGERGVALCEIASMLVAGRVEVGRSLEGGEDARLVAGFAEVLGGPREVLRLLLGGRGHVRALDGGLRRALPHVPGDEAPLRGLPELVALLDLRGGAVGLARGRGIFQVLAEPAEAFEEGPAGDRIGDPGEPVGDDLGRAVDRAGLFEELGRRRHGAVVFRRELRDTRPRLGRRGRVAALVLVERGELLLEGDLLLDVALGARLLLDEVGEVVPALRALEEAAQRLPARFVGAIEREELPPCVRRAFRVAERPFAEPRHFAEAPLPFFDRLARRGHRAEEHVAERRVVALGAKVVLDPREGLGVDGVHREDLAVLVVRLGARAAAREDLRRVEEALERVPRHVRHLRRACGRRDRRGRRHVLAALRVELDELRGRLCVPERTERLEDLDRVVDLLRGFIARRDEPPRVRRHRAAGIHLQVAEVARGDVVFAL